MARQDRELAVWQASLASMDTAGWSVAELAARVAGTSPELDDALVRAKEATDAFVTWLEGELPSRTEPSGVGVENYDWYVKNVHLVPFTWADLVGIHRRELARSHGMLKLEEERNRGLPPQTRVATAEEYDQRLNQAVTDYIAFLGDRDPLTMRTHGHHWFDLAMMAADPHPSPIRSNPLLYNIWDSRAEAVAFASRWTPRGWMPAESGAVWGEQDLYLHQPFYGDSYLTGKHQIEELMAERAQQLGDGFSFKGFMDEMEASGLIPVSLIRWEMTGKAPAGVE